MQRGEEMWDGGEEMWNGEGACMGQGGCATSEIPFSLTEYEFLTR